jgi:hypothetical protein
MAMNNFNASIVGRGASCLSHNVIAKAAYQGREKLQDERTGASHNYTTKDGLEWKGLFLPKGAPEWMNDRQKLYNEIERKEDAGTKPDKAQLVHSWILTLPHELSAEQRKWFMTDFGRELTRKGRVVDIALHTPDVAGDDRNYHAHVLMTMREVNADGFGKKFTAPDVERGDPEGKKKFQKWAKEELAAWKDRYSELGAHYLERAGYAVEGERFRHGHKTLKEQLKEAELRGDAHWVRHLADREPTKHVGPQATGMERKEKGSIRTRKGDINREIEDRNWLRQNERDIEDFLRNLPPERRPNDQVTRQLIPVWWAVECSKSAADLRENLKKEGWQLARVTKDDEVRNKNRRMVAEKFKGPYQPELIEGDYVAVNPRGMAFHLNERSTGRSFREMKAFMATLDKEHVNSLRAAENFALHKLSKISRGRGGRDSGISRMGDLRNAGRIAGATLGLVGTGVSLLTSLVDRTLTPEQKVGRNLDDAKKKLAAERAEKVKKIERPKEQERER